MFLTRKVCDSLVFQLLLSTADKIGQFFPVGVDLDERGRRDLQGQSCINQVYARAVVIVWIWFALQLQLWRVWKTFRVFRCTQCG